MYIFKSPMTQQGCGHVAHSFKTLKVHLNSGAKKITLVPGSTLKTVRTSLANRNESANVLNGSPTVPTRVSYTKLISV